MGEATKQVATILKLHITDDLARVVADYLAHPGLSLLGEADSAVEWIADPARNRKRQRMTPAFFRRWLKRETETDKLGYALSSAPAAGSARKARAQSTPVIKAVNGTGPPGALSAENPYQAFVRKRAQDVLRRSQIPEEAQP